jgi:carbamoyltransferase
VLKLCRTLHEETGEKNLCMAGGVALNCVANSEVLREGPFENLWIQPAAGDAGGALGVALAVSYTMGNSSQDHTTQDHTTNEPDGMHGCYLGPRSDTGSIRNILDEFGADYEELAEEPLLDTVAKALANEKIVGWFQGRMEFGPRALGNRSILADPCSPRMQRLLNLKIKYRESFRPFAPAVLRDSLSEYFDLDCDSPYMLLVAPVTDSHRIPLTDDDKGRRGLDKLHVIRSDIPAVTHVDYSARVQTVHFDTNPLFYKLIKVFKGYTGRGVLVNTSFNVRDEPIVCTPQDAFRCFMASEMDVLVLGSILLFKEKQ